MRRGLVALILWSLVGAAALCAYAGPEASGDGTGGAISVSVRDGTIGDVIETIMHDAGANVVMDGDIADQRITLRRENVHIERVMEDICQAKGLHWWRNEDGTYIISSRPRPAPRAEVQALPGVSESGTHEMVRRMYTVQFVAPQYVSYLFGFSEDPGPQAYLLDRQLGEAGRASLRGLGSSTRRIGEAAAMGGMGGMGGGGMTGGMGGMGGMGGGGMAGGMGGMGGMGAGGMAAGAAGGVFSTLLPPGVEEMIAYPMLNALILTGTEEGVNEFIELLKLIDRKPQQVIVELQAVQVSSELVKEMGVQWYYILGNTTIEPIGFSTGASFQVGYTPPGSPNFQATLTYLMQTGRGRLVDAVRIHTMNLLPAVNQVVVSYPVVQVGGVPGGGLGGGGVQTVSVTYDYLPTILYVVPQILGDGTITMTVPFSRSVQTGAVPVPLADYGSYNAPIITTSSIVATVNVRDGETFVIGGSVQKTFQETWSRVPLLSDIPVVGDFLFTRRTFRTVDQETLLFITPRIVKEEAAPATLGPI